MLGHHLNINEQWKEANTDRFSLLETLFIDSLTTLDCLNSSLFCVLFRRNNGVNKFIVKKWLVD
jgi:hypothetical protein